MTNVKKDYTKKEKAVMNWRELNRAIKEKFKKGSDFSDDIVITFSKFKDDERVLTIVSEDIDNQYGDLSADWRWEIYLYSNGTWTIR